MDDLLISSLSARQRYSDGVPLNEAENQPAKRRRIRVIADRRDER